MLLYVLMFLPFSLQYFVVFTMSHCWGTMLSNSCLLILLRNYADQLIGAEWRIYALVQHTNIASDNGLSPVRRQAIVWTNAAILSIRPWGTYFSEILSKIQKFSFKEMHLKMSSAKVAAILPSLNVLVPDCYWLMLLTLGLAQKMSLYSGLPQNYCHIEDIL